MPDIQPSWWPRVVTAADRRRHVTGLLLRRATPRLLGDVLQLTFSGPGVEQAWRESEAQAALEAALRQHGIQVSVVVCSSPVRGEPVPH